MAITVFEKEYLIKEMRKLLDEFNYTYTLEALNVIIDTWADSKADLIEAFKKHPNYIEGKFMIAYDADFEREIDHNKIDAFSCWLINLDRLQNLLPTLPKDVNDIRAPQGTYLPRDLFYILNSLHLYTDRTVTDNLADIINRNAPGAHIHAGQKTTRAINKLCKYLGYDKDPDYNREFAKYADAINPLKITRHTVLSINPIDYLTMSFGNSWSSCHTIDKLNIRNMPNGYEGMYSSGTVSYMLDSSSMVFYTLDKDYDGDKFYEQPKITRQMFHYNNQTFVQGRLYPADGSAATSLYEQYRHLVQQILSEIFNLPNLWTVNKGYISSEYVYSAGTHYRDYHHFSECNISKHQERENYGNVYIGHMPICIECGREHGIENSINCCTSSYTCYDCGRSIDGDDVYWIDGDPYCQNCISWCEHCQEYHINESYYIYNFGYVCEDCFREYYECCEECEENYYRADMYYIASENIYVCEDCYNNYYRSCVECGEVYNKHDMYKNSNGDYVCEDCYEEEENDNEQEAV